MVGKNELIHSLLDIKLFSGLPYKLNFAITYRCDHRCLSCNIWKRYLNNKDWEKELRLDEFEKIFENISNSLIWISLTGGEPFLRKDLIDIIQSLDQKCKKLRILNMPTNGSQPYLIEKTINEVLKESKIPIIYVTVSLNGTREIHDMTRGVKGSFDKAIDTINNLLKLARQYKALNVGVEYLITPWNLGRFKMLITELRQRIIDLKNLNYTVALMQAGAMYGLSKQLIDDAFYIKAKNEVKDILAIYSLIDNINRKSWFNTISRIYLNLLYSYLSNGIKECVIPCSAASSSFFIDPYGDVYPCITMNERLGNLRDVNYEFSKIFSNPKAKSVRENIAKGLCPICWTPCEAITSIVSRPITSLIKLVSRGARKKHIPSNNKIFVKASETGT